MVDLDAHICSMLTQLATESGSNGEYIMFAAELDTISADIQLQIAIKVRAAAVLKRFCALSSGEGGPRCPVDNEQALGDLCGLVDSVVKFALVAVPEKANCFDTMVGVFGHPFFYRRLKKIEMKESFPIRRVYWIAAR